MNDFLDSLYDWFLPVSIFIIVMCFSFICYTNINSAYQEKTMIGNVIDQKTEKYLACAKPVIYKTKYITEIELSDKTKISLFDSSIYFSCKIGDQVLIKVTYQYYDSDLLDIHYSVIDGTLN